MVLLVAFPMMATGLAVLELAYDEDPADVLLGTLRALAWTVCCATILAATAVLIVTA